MRLGVRVDRLALLEHTNGGEDHGPALEALLGYTNERIAELLNLRSEIEQHIRNNARRVHEHRRNGG